MIWHSLPSSAGAALRGPNAAVYAVVPSPASIPEPLTAEPHDALDLTAPTEPEPEPAAARPVAEEPPAADEPLAAETVNGTEETESTEAPTAPPPVRDYETVNQPPSQPRRGWWKRLTE